MSILSDELTNDPLGRYSGLNNQAIVDSLNAKNRDLPKQSLTGDEVFSVTDETEYGGLSIEDKGLWLSFTARNIINPFNSANIEFVTSIFGAGNTVAALDNLRTISNGQSRAQELRIRSPVRLSDVEKAQ